MQARRARLHEPEPPVGGVVTLAPGKPSSDDRLGSRLPLMLTRARAQNSRPDRRSPAAEVRERDPPIYHLAQQPRLRRTTTPHPRPGRSLLAALVHTHREARMSSLERTAPASSGSRSVRTGKARQPGPLGTPRGSRARTDHMSRSSPATCRSAAGPRCPARGTISIAGPATRAPAACPPINTERLYPPPDTGGDASKA